MVCRVWRLALATAVAWTSLAHAEPPIVESAKLAIDRDQAARLGAAQGPGVSLASAPREAVIEARSAASGLPRPTTVTLSTGYRAGAFTPGIEFAVTAVQDIALRRLGDARAKTADAMHVVVEADVARAHVEAAARGAMAWVGACEWRDVLRLREEALVQARAVASTLRARVDAGTAQPYERALADAEVGTADAARLDAEGAQTEALAELRFALGLTPGTWIEPVGELEPNEELPIRESVAIARAETQHPDLVLASARARASAEEGRLISAALGPTVGLGVSYVQEGTGDHVALGIVSVPIPFFDAARFDVARHDATARTLVADAERIRNEVARDVRLAIHEGHHWRDVVRALEREAIGPTEDAERLARVACEAGTRDLTLLLLARQRRIAAHEELVHAQAHVQRADIELVRASGQLPTTGRRP